MEKQTLRFLLTGLSALGLLFTFMGTTSLPPKDEQYYEMRIYYAPAGKLDALQSRFRNHTTKLFEKHGMKNVGYWVPLENVDNALVYVLAFPNKEAREKAWKDFGADPEWHKVQKTTEAEGKLVDSIKSAFMKRTDYSPKVSPSAGKAPRTFELRTYTTLPGKLPDLHNRFRDHTMKLFKKHGMTNIAYWEVIPAEHTAPNTLTYILAHSSKEAGEQSFKAFREDPEWQQAKNASEANGPIVEKVLSVYMAPADYSAIK